ncbi:terminase TerL endonuclease subunit [uncultured Mameliella sp.]|uniref:terminase TerL endonuclease subunit n=1 Tax=uncultured Mameliella sp. TaxID=1447087 RepID=UPI002630255C|nr:terminase TerL endonuclease subunit [uncultured Mameliella sp.]
MATRLKKTPSKAIKFIESLNIPEGPLAGKKMKLAPFQRNFIANALDPETQYAFYSIGRGGAKTMLGAAIALAHLSRAYDEQPNRQIIAAARTAEQARILWAYVRALIETLPEEEQARYSIKQAPRLEIHCEGNGNGMLKAIAADAKNALGLSPTLILGDEMGHWENTKGAELFAALESSLGKRGGKMLCLSTSASSDQHFFSQLLDDLPSRSFKIEHRAPSDLPIDDIEGIKLANPGAEFGIGASLEWLQDQAQRAIKRGGHAAASYRLYHLNQRVSADSREMLLEVDDWLACEVAPDDLPPREGPCVIGIDIGGSASMSAASFYWPATHRLEALACVPGNPSLADRGANDGVGGRYVEMQERGELAQMGDLTVPIAPFLEKVMQHVEGCNVVALTMDRYKAAELTEAVTKAGIRAPLVWRGQGFRDGGEDAERLRRASFDGKVKTLPSLLLRSAFADAVVVRDDANNMKITKARSLGRIDAVSATCLAVAEGARRMAAPATRAPRIAWA